MPKVDGLDQGDLGYGLLTSPFDSFHNSFVGGLTGPKGELFFNDRRLQATVAKSSPPCSGARQMLSLDGQRRLALLASEAS